MQISAARNLLYFKGLPKRHTLSIVGRARFLSTPLCSIIPGYTYTRTIAGKIFNNRKVVNELNMDCGTAGMVCSCNSSRYKYESCGHVVTGDLSIIKDVKLRNLISKGPAYREQNSIDWRMNLKNSKLCKFFKKFVSRHNALFSKYGVSVRTHVHEGICIPLVVKHELSKHITTSRGHST